MPAWECREQDIWPCSGELKTHMRRELGELPALEAPAAHPPVAAPVKLGASMKASPRKPVHGTSHCFSPYSPRWPQPTLLWLQQQCSSLGPHATALLSM